MHVQDYPRFGMQAYHHMTIRFVDDLLWLKHQDKVILWGREAGKAHQIAQCFCALACQSRNVRGAVVESGNHTNSTGCIHSCVYHLGARRLTDYALFCPLLSPEPPTPYSLLPTPHNSGIAFCSTTRSRALLPDQHIVQGSIRFSTRLSLIATRTIPILKGPSVKPKPS